MINATLPQSEPGHNTAQNADLVATLGTSEYPKLCNTGVEVSFSSDLYSYSVDWFRYTVGHSVAFQSEIKFPEGSPFAGHYQPLGAVLPHPIFSLAELDRKPFKNYNRAVNLTAGSVHWHTENPKQKVLVELSGQDWNSIVLAGVDPHKVIEHPVDSLGNVTRLDFAVDCFAPGASPGDILEAWKTGALVTAAASVTPTGSIGRGNEDLGQTVYVGSYKSDRFVRVYDKAKESGVPGPWVRIEIEAKGSYASWLALSMTEYGVIPAGKAFLRDFISSTGVGWFDTAIAGDGGKYLEPKMRKRSDKVRYYERVVVPMIDRDLTGPDGSEIYHLLSLVVPVEWEKERYQHGGVIKPHNQLSKRFKAALRVLEQDFDMGGGLSRAAFLRSGEVSVYKLLESAGYKWVNSNKDWIKT